MHIPAELWPVIQITLPIVLTIFIAAWSQNKRLDDIVARLARIENKLETHGERIATLEGRVNPPLLKH